MTPETMIEARGLGKAYRTPAGELRVRQGVVLEVAAGEMVAIVGASGVGKSTLLHVLGTLDRPDAGSLQIAGEDVLGLGEPERCAFRNRVLGFVFQFHHLLPEFSALENASMPLLVAGRKRREAEEIAEGLLRDVGLGHRLTHKPGELSGGQQQRVAIARALIHSPSVVLADEPTASLDTERAHQVVATFADLIHEQKRTGIMVTHDLRMTEYADRVIGLTLAEIQKIPYRIGVAASAAKALPIYGALRGGYLHALITVEAAASGVLKLFDNSFRKTP